MMISGRIWSEESENPQREPPEASAHRRDPPRAYLPHAERTNPDGVCRSSGSKPTARKAQIPSGNGRDREANAGSRKARGNHNPPDRVHAQPERALTRSW